MSHSHSHAPGQSCSHSHSPAPGQVPPGAQQQQFVAPPPPDPSIQALIDQSFHPVDLKLGEPNNSHAYCGKHSKEKCEECGVDFTDLNNLAKVFIQNPNLICPPPPQVIQQQRSQAVNKTKEDGNTLFKAHKYKEALSMYTMAASVASQRLPWEPSQLMKEELATVLSNRCAAHMAAKDYISALADAETVIQLKRPWSKGHFRKAKALVELGHLEEAREAVNVGLQFEPNNTELSTYLAEIDGKISKSKQ